MKTGHIFWMLFLALGGYCQNPYEGVTTVTADGITFKVELGVSFVLFNTANYADNASLRYKDGRELETLDEYAVLDARMEPGTETRAIREAFGDAVIESLRIYNICPMNIFYVVGPDGDTLEVSFIMRKVPELVSLSPEVFAALEHNLKKYVKWEVNKYGRQLEFLHRLSFINFNSIPLESELKTLLPDAVPIP